MQRITRLLGLRPEDRTSLANRHIPASLVLAGVLAITGSTFAAPARIVGGDGVEQGAEAAKVKADLDAAVKAGRITEAQARERFAGWEKQQAQRMDPRAEAAKVKADLDAAVKAGRITEAQARERFAGWEKRQAERMDPRAEAAKVKADLDAAVKAGRITEAQANEQFASWERQFAEGVEVRAKIAKVRAELDGAVKAGKITQAQANEKFEAFRKKQGEKRIVRETEDPEVEIRKTEQNDPLENAKRRIEAGVKAGRMTPEQGRERLEAFKKDLDAKSRKEKPRKR